MKGSNGNTLLRGRLKMGAATLTVIAVLLAAAVTAGLKQTAVPTSSAPEKGTVYALSYDALDTQEGFLMMQSDIEYMQRRGLRFILPGEEGKGGVILIAQGRCDVQKLAEMLQDNGARAVLVMSDDLSEPDAVASFRYADEGLFAPAVPVDIGCSRVGAFRKLATAGEAFALRFGRKCDIFVSTVPDETDISCFNGGKTGRITLFVFGNGRSEGPFPKSGLVVLDRCMRLPDWTIEQFFYEIAADN